MSVGATNSATPRVPKQARIIYSVIHSFVHELKNSYKLAKVELAFYIAIVESLFIYYQICFQSISVKFMRSPKTDKTILI